MKKIIIIPTMFRSDGSINLDLGKFLTINPGDFVPTIKEQNKFIPTPVLRPYQNKDLLDNIVFATKQGVSLLHNFVYKESPFIGLAMDSIFNYGIDFSLNKDLGKTTFEIAGSFIGNEVFRSSFLGGALGGAAIGGLLTTTYDDAKSGADTQRIVDYALETNHPNAQFAKFLQEQNTISRANPFAGATYTDEYFIRELVATHARVDPLIFDLNRDGKINLTSLSKSTVFFDMLGRGLLDRTAWIAPEDGMLVLDKNRNGKIDNFSEIFSEIYEEGVKTALGALSTLDSNHDYKFNSSDTKFYEVKMWQDLNSDGISQANELKTLAELGITEISLATTLKDNEVNEGNQIVSETTAIRNGQNIKVEEVALLTQLGGYTYKETNGNTKYYENKETVLAVGNGAVTVQKDANAVITGAGNDNINITSTKNGIQINSGAGSDIITGNSNFQIAVYEKTKDSYTITQNGNTWTVKDKQSNDIDTLTGIERIKFKDEIIHTDSTNNNPVITEAGLETRNNKPLTISSAQLLATVTDQDGDYLKIVSISNVKHGKAAIEKDGNITFTPAIGFYGKASFDYTVEDGYGGKAIGTATINILPPAPTDNLFDQQWYLKAANIIPVWDDYTGRGVKIGILDDGITNHPDLPNVELIRMNQSSGADSFIGDAGTHGTFLAGLIGALRNGTGTVGVAYGALLKAYVAYGNTAFDMQEQVDVSSNSWMYNPGGAGTIYSGQPANDNVRFMELRGVA